MSLPACQQRALDAMDKSLQASEPRLASMFAMFTRLTQGEEPADAERLPRRSRWLRSVRQVRTFVLIPVMAAIAISGVLLGVTTRGAQACGAVYAAGRLAAVRSAPTCSRPLPGRPPPQKTQQKTQPETQPETQPRKTQPATRQVVKTVPAISLSGCAPPYLATLYLVTLARREVCYGQAK